VIEVVAGDGMNFDPTRHWIDHLRLPDVRLALPTSPHVLGAASRVA